MNREIKFKAKRVDGKGWVYGDLKRMVIGGNLKHYTQELDSKPIEVIPETVCQFTGLKDKNRVDIYEGDKLGCVDEMIIVEYDVECCQFRFVSCYLNNENWEEIEYLSSTDYNLYSLEVTGNKHD